jgi:hypothetical protein
MASKQMHMERRLMKELKKFREEPPTGMKLDERSVDANIACWLVDVEGAEGEVNCVLNCLMKPAFHKSWHRVCVSAWLSVPSLFKVMWLSQALCTLVKSSAFNLSLVRIIHSILLRFVAIESRFFRFTHFYMSYS